MMKKRSLFPLQCIHLNHSHIENHHMRGAIVDHLAESDTTGRFPRSRQEWLGGQICYMKIVLRLWLIRSSGEQVRIWHFRHQPLNRWESTRHSCGRIRQTIILHGGRSRCPSISRNVDGTTASTSEASFAKIRMST